MIQVKIIMQRFHQILQLDEEVDRNYYKQLLNLNFKKNFYFIKLQNEEDIKPVLRDRLRFKRVGFVNDSFVVIEPNVPAVNETD